MTTRISQQTKEAIATELKKNPDVIRTELAKKYDVSRGTVYAIAKNIHAVLAPIQVNVESKVQAHKDQSDQWKALYKAAMVRMKEMRTEMDVFSRYQTLQNLIVPQNSPVAPYRGSKQAIPVLVLSDWHVDEEVDPLTINGLNEYNISIAKDRVARLTKFAVKILSILKRESAIEELVIAALGDFMSGWIHDELQAASAMTPPAAVLEILNMMTGLIQGILDSGIIKKIRMVCCVGNHSRITKRTYYQIRAKTSYEWMLYHLIMQHFNAKGETRIEFQIPTGYFNWVSVCGKYIRCHHGDAIIYRGGVGGVHIPANKAVAQWDKARRAFLDIFSHFHTLKWEEKYVINGSLIGYNAYAESLKCDFEKAKQSIFLIHNRFGKTGQYPIVVQD